LVLTVIMLVFSAGSNSWAMSKKQEKPEYAPGEVLVAFNDGVSQDRIEQIVAGESATVRKIIGNGAVHLIVLPDDLEVMAAVERFSVYPEVKYAEPNYKAQRLEN